MQILVLRCGRLLFYNFSLTRSTTPLISSSFVAYFRSTPTIFEKWKYKWDSSSDSVGPKISKTYINYKARQKRADAKKALNHLLFRSVGCRFSLEGDGDNADLTDNSYKRIPLKSSARGATKSHQKRNKNNPKKDLFEDFDDHPGMHFQAMFGNKWYSRSFKSWEESFSQSQTTGFEWREESDGTNSRNNRRTAHDVESDEESYFVGSNSDRIALGLPLNGPLKINEVKNAFHLSALKWHPDKHQGPSQALAEEKFKLCANAYKSLCNALLRV